MEYSQIVIEYSMWCYEMNIAVLLLHCMLYVGFRAMHESMTSHKIKTWGPGGQAPPRWLRACDDVAETVASRHVTTAGAWGALHPDSETLWKVSIFYIYTAMCYLGFGIISPSCPRTTVGWRSISPILPYVSSRVRQCAQSSERQNLKIINKLSQTDFTSRTTSHYFKVTVSKHFMCEQ